MVANGFAQTPQWAQIDSSLKPWARVVWRLMAQRVEGPSWDWIRDGLGMTPQRWSIERHLPETGWLYLERLARMLSMPSSRLAAMFRAEVEKRKGREYKPGYAAECEQALEAAKREAARPQGWYRGAGRGDGRRKGK